MRSSTAGASANAAVTERCVRLLSGIHLFRGLPERVIARLATVAVRKAYERGARVFSQGDDADSLYCVISGRVRIDAVGVSGQEVFLNEMGPGDSFGEIAVLDGLPRTAGATATARTALLAIHRREFLQLVDEEKELATHLLSLFCARMRWTTDLYEDSAFLSSSARLAKRVLGMAAHLGSFPGEIIEIRVSQSELGRFLGTSRKSVFSSVPGGSRVRSASYRASYCLVLSVCGGLS